MFVGLAGVKYTVFIQGFHRKYGVYIRFRPTLRVCGVCVCMCMREWAHDMQILL